jgi:AcrR family transcriptional regulator
MLLQAPQQEKLDPRVKRTRNLIFRAFSELLAEKGFQAVTVQDIARRAEINRATFYAHFPDKYALLQYSIRRAFEEELEKRTLSACHYSEENLRALIVIVCDFIAQSSHNCKSSGGQFDAIIEGQVREQILELLQLWLEQTSLSQDEMDIAATAATWAIYGLAQHWVRMKNKPPLDEYIRQIIPLIVPLLMAI